MSEQEKNAPYLDKRSSRRTFIKNSGLTVGGVVLGGALGSLLGKDSTTQTHETGVHSTATAVNFNQALMYFDKAQFDTIDAAAEQIFPKSEVGPGAKELLVTYYIDHQLAGSWGLNSKEYMSAPFYPAEASSLFGHQTHLNRQQIFNLGIEALNSEAAKQYKAKFSEITEEEQVSILQAFEEGEVTLNGAVTSTYFFALLKSATIEGAYADPLYGGNKDMAGWKMKNFPGHQMSYANIIEKDEFVKIEPTSLNSQHKH
ncbi:gluconate 2-dehydrogenase subunit 3 family protein [Psychrobacillus sp. INOP01]|uniref:gluconate 2-dehydrogenase subunit 3 family protein n=1 Tax=Psychrobacillus sp. INOP01 TaxID=2829187 RepID=UPI001BA43CB9|nr:gluconate 2-dehydrogenase subunit 3 family protein [Psychrobacillus sp. INOP01]QUG40163.1 gluconate 2-dehydrogenase subunit 3 family protein [Psychrobacillus sp. INOP01]